jgi:hypothetical protein
MALAMDSGSAQRLAILENEAERHFIEPLKVHGWNAAIESSSPNGQFLIISASRGGHQHKVALLYSSSTDNLVYKTLAQQVEHIYYQGEPYQLEAYTQGVEKPVSGLRDFGTEIVRWNRESSEGKFSPANDDAHVGAERPPIRRLLSEEPIAAIWLRLRQLQSVTLAKKLIATRSQQANVELDEDTLHQKAEGVAFALRNAADYFNARDLRNVSQRVLNLYYGSLAFASAEMLASPHGANTLSEIEKSTVQGHGLYTVDGAASGLENLIVGAISNGFFPEWLRVSQLGNPNLPRAKVKKFSDVAAQPRDSWITVEELFASIPEVGDLFVDIFDSAPRWVTPVFDQMTNMGLIGFGKRPLNRSYVLLIDDSARLTKEDIAAFPGPISEIAAISSIQSGRHFRVGVDHAGHDYWWGALKIQHSPFERNALLRPIFGVVDDYRCICVVLLYALSIIVRYRPSIWRRVQEGDLDHMRALIEAFLAVAERVLPEQFLVTVSGQPVSANQPGSFFS